MRYTDDDLAELFLGTNRFPLFAFIAHEQETIDTLARIAALRIIPDAMTDAEWADARRRSIAAGWAWQTAHNDGEPCGLEYRDRPTFHS